MPIRLSSASGSLQEAERLPWAADHGADVISCSWGPADGAWWHARRPAAQPAGAAAGDHPAGDRLRRHPGPRRQGCVILFAAGNGNESVDNDGYASYERVIAVAACNDRGKRSVYSDFGARRLVRLPEQRLRPRRDGATRSR